MGVQEARESWPFSGNLKWVFQQSLIHSSPKVSSLSRTGATQSKKEQMQGARKVAASSVLCQRQKLANKPSDPLSGTAKEPGFFKNIEK